VYGNVFLYKAQNWKDVQIDAEKNTKKRQLKDQVSMMLVLSDFINSNTASNSSSVNALHSANDSQPSPSSSLHVVALKPQDANNPRRAVTEDAAEVGA